MNSCKEHSIVFQISQKLKVRIWMSKIIKLPTNLNFRRSFYSELLFNKLMSNNHIIDHFTISRTRFIMHRPSSIYQFQLTISYQFTYLFLFPGILHVPPHWKELHLCLSKFSLRIIQESIDDWSDDEIYSAKLTWWICILDFVKVAIETLQPAHVIMGMWHEVHGRERWLFL